MDVRQPYPVLIVDDDEATRETLCLILEEESIQSDIANDGVEALDLLLNDPTPRIILIDHQMPRMSGTELLTVIAADPVLANRHAPIYCTAYSLASLDGVAAVLERLAVPVLAKPFNISDLFDCIDEATHSLTVRYQTRN